MTDRLASSGRGRLAAFLAAGFAYSGFVCAPPAAAQTQLPPPARYAPADERQDTIEELQGQLREATAQNEQLQYQLMQANREITRLRGMVGELATVNQSVSTGAPDAGAAPAPAADDGKSASESAAPSSLNAAQQRATGTLGSVNETALPPPPMPVREAGDDYSRARELLNNGQLAEAEIAFQDFLEQHGDNTNAADARYWLAFTLLARNNYSDAAANFVNYLQHNGRAARAPEAQVRLGMALAGMGQTRQACGAFSQLTTRYPNAPRNVRDLAVREARAAQCAA